MGTYRYKKADAFTSGDSMGNPAACIYLEDGQTLTDSEMLEIAKQHKGFVSEVIYCRRKSPSSFGLTYYSSECEVDFCGHGTIACIYSLIKETPDLMNLREIEIHTGKKGVLTVYNEVPDQDSVYITAPAPEYIGTALSAAAAADILQMDSAAISDEYPIDVIDAGLRTLIVPIKSLETEINVCPDEQNLKTFCLENDLDIILIFSNEVSDKKNIAHTRVFAPKFGYLEDPATGSGNSAFGYYMLRHSLWDGGGVSIEQGGAGRIYNIVRLYLKDARVLFGGKATTRIGGKYFL